VTASLAGGHIVSIAGDHNTVHVAQAMSALTSRVALAPPKLSEWGLVGRDDDLARLHEVVESCGSAAVVPVAGLGGLGKTALAVGYVGAYGHHFDLIAWVHAEEPDLIPGQYQHLLRNRTGRDLAEAGAVAAVLALLAETDNWLLVFDNATSATAIEDYLPAGGGSILVTTRNETWSADPKQVVRLDRLPDDTVAKWLTAALPDAGADAIGALVSRLDGLPLAVVQAIAYITSRPGETAASYIGKLATRDGQRAVLTQKRPAGYPEPVATTWNVAIDSLMRNLPEAVDLLDFLAYINPDSMPIALIEGLQPGVDLPGLLEALRSFGMIRCSATELSVHRLVQDITRWPLTPEQEASHVTSWGAHLLAIAPDHEDHRSFDWFRSAAPHLLALSGHAVNLRINALELAEIGHRTGISLNDQAAHVAARTMLQRVLAIRERACGPEHPEVGRTLSQLGVAHRGLGHQREAVDVQERGLFILQGAYGQRHPDVGRTLNNLGRARARLGEYDLAAELHERARASYEALFGHNHLDVAVSLTSLGVARLGLGDHVKCLEALEEALAIFLRLHGPDHPQVAWALGNLGLAYLDQGRHRDAIEVYQHALPLFEDAYGPDHRDVALTLIGLGAGRAGLGEFSEAVALHERALTKLRGIYGEEHSYVARALTNLGTAHQGLRDTQRAADLYARALAINETVVGPDHRDTRAVRRLLDLLSESATRPE